MHTAVVAAMKWFQLSLALMALLLPATAASGEPRRVRIGIGPQVQPEFPGADSLEVLPFPSFSIASGDKPFRFGAPDDSLSIALFSTGGFSIGPAAALSAHRDESDVGAPVGDVDRTIEVGGFVQQYLSENFRLRAEVRKGLGGHDGIIGSVGGDYVARDGDRYTLSIGPRLRFADSEYMDSFYGVRPEVSILTLLPVHDPDGGIEAFGAIGGFTYSLGGPFGLYGYARYDRLVGDAKNSPIVQEFGSPDQFSAGIGVSYIFDINL
jgi:outer membrane protein